MVQNTGTLGAPEPRATVYIQQILTKLLQFSCVAVCETKGERWGEEKMPVVDEHKEFSTTHTQNLNIKKLRVEEGNGEKWEKLLGTYGRGGGVLSTLPAREEVITYILQTCQEYSCTGIELHTLWFIGCRYIEMETMHSGVGGIPSLISVIALQWGVAYAVSDRFRWDSAHFFVCKILGFISVENRNLGLCVCVFV